MLGFSNAADKIAKNLLPHKRYIHELGKSMFYILTSIDYMGHTVRYGLQR